MKHRHQKINHSQREIYMIQGKPQELIVHLTQKVEKAENIEAVAKIKNPDEGKW